MASRRGPGVGPGAVRQPAPAHLQNPRLHATFSYWTRRDAAQARYWLTSTDQPFGYYKTGSRSSRIGLPSAPAILTSPTASSAAERRSMARPKEDGIITRVATDAASANCASPHRREQRAANPRPSKLTYWLLQQQQARPAGWCMQWGRGGGRNLKYFLIFSHHHAYTLNQQYDYHETESYGIDFSLG